MSASGFPLRFERRLKSAPRWLIALHPVISVLVALVIAGIVLAISGYDVIGTYSDMVRQAVTNKGALSGTLAASTPLVFTGLAAAFAFSMKAWNIGGEGQLFVGAICATAAGVAVGDNGLAVALPAMLAAGIMGGGLWAAIPGLLRAYLNTNEVLTSLMLNYVAGLLMYYLIFDSTSYLRDTTSATAQTFPQSKELDSSAYWPQFTGGGVVVPLGFVLAVVLAVGLYVVARHTRFGFQMRVVADSPAAGRYAGIRTKRLFALVMVISGALAGLAGVSQIGEFGHTLDPMALEGAQYFYTGIVAAALVRFNPLGVIISAVFLGGIANAGFNLQGDTFPLGLVGTIEGIILFAVLSGDVMMRYRVTVRRDRVTPEPAAPLLHNTAISNDPAGRTS